MRSLLLSALLSVVCLVGSLRADSPTVRGHVVDPSDLPLPGVSVTLRPASGGEPTTTVTDENGGYQVDDVSPGQYSIEASLDGFDKASRTDLSVPAGGLTVDLKLALAVVHQNVEVVAQAPVNMIGKAQPNAPVTVTRSVMDVAMLPNSQYDDVLPLMPNVVRGPDGLISVGGARAQTGGLFVNGISAGNPITGGAGLMLPLEAVETMQVYAGGAPAEFSHATGGITAVTTRSGSDRFHMSLDSFLPRLLYTNGGIGGVAFWDPNLGFSGPIVRGRATFQQAISYRYDRNTYTTLQGPDHNIFNGLYSWTQLDVQLASSQRLRVSVGADPRQTDRANITAFTPSDSAPRVEQGGWTTRVTDDITAGPTVIELHASAFQTGANVQPHGSSPYVMTHQLVEGSYFDEQDRSALALDTGARLTWSPKADAVFSTGVSLRRSTLEQTLASNPVEMLRSDGSLAREITVGQPSTGHAEIDSVGVFVQGRWVARPWLTLDAGVRFDETSDASDPPPSPRVGWTISHNDGRTTLSGSAGLFADIVPLDALAFGFLPVRTIVETPVDGIAATTTRINVLAPDLQVPRAARWDIELAHNAGPWTMRVRYEERRGTNELVVQPSPPASLTDASQTAVVLLSNGGSSRSRSLETTMGLRRPGGGELYVSYVRAATSGDLNSLADTEGLLRPVFEQVNLRGPLPSDVPNRLLAWGLFHLRGKLTFAPFLEMRSGFPYLAINDSWLVTDVPGTHRLPWMTSLDLSATRIISLPHHLPDARVGLKLYNILSWNTEREVQRDIERADFGTRYDPVPRDFSVVFEFLWGRGAAASRNGS